MFECLNVFECVFYGTVLFFQNVSFETQTTALPLWRYARYILFKTDKSYSLLCIMLYLFDITCCILRNSSNYIKMIKFVILSFSPCIVSGFQTILERNFFFQSYNLKGHYYFVKFHNMLPPSAKLWSTRVVSLVLWSFQFHPFSHILPPWTECLLTFVSQIISPNRNVYLC